jgi:hypothetical protein
MFAIDEPPIFEIAQGQPHGDTAYIKASAKLMLARDREGRLLCTLQDFVSKGGN